MTQPTDLPQPRWLRPTLIGLVLGELALALLIDARVSPDEHAPWAARLGAVLLIGLTWLLELAGARLPRPVLVLVVAVLVAWLNVAREGTASLLFLVMAVAWGTYTSAYRTSLAVLAIGLLACLSFLVVVDPEGWLSTSVGIVVTWFAVRGLVRQHQLLLEQQRLVAQLREAQADLAREARAAERRRIAREIHDVAAHTLAVTMLQLTGVRLLLQRTGGDPRAVEALGQAEDLGRQGLDDVRRTVGLLSDGERAGEAALPSAGDIERLVADYRAAGLDVILDVRGDLMHVPAAVGLALYRICQEALANAAKHAAGAPVRVAIDLDGAAHVRVRNAAPDPGARRVAAEAGHGQGVPGMRERAELLGGTLAAGPDGDGWLVDCSLPLMAHSSPGLESARTDTGTS